MRYHARMADWCLLVYRLGGFLTVVGMLAGLFVSWWAWWLVIAGVLLVVVSNLVAAVAAHVIKRRLTRYPYRPPRSDSP